MSFFSLSGPQVQQGGRRSLRYRYGALVEFHILPKRKVVDSMKMALSVAFGLFIFHLQSHSATKRAYLLAKYPFTRVYKSP